ncbi:hypothetical protein SEA_ARCUSANGELUS_86 [Mycobacterium phage ArcusAngelus]|uniref:Uncharacterized protein n=1 Tax=Mycobacterium phage ArcusAngelus TaxID=2315613 RepID=A0A386KRY6_9CAUD|nr:hypothetical protein I5H13_gp085 [Mycobacterium phage ArcusAngelus]AYD87834.1 hypothetical protein SEA_ARCUSANGELUS_86 [Mycobacterium phage ArcusAngelus]
MAEFPTLAEIAAGHVSDGYDYCSCGWRYSWADDAPGWYVEWSLHLQGEWRKSRTVETVEQLDALSEFAVIRDRVGEVWEKENHLGDEVRCWWRNGSDGQHDRTAVRLPAILLWHPEVDA